MDSQITLVNPYFADTNEPAEVLVFSRDNVKDTIISLSGNPAKELYTVKTDLAITETLVFTPYDVAGSPLARIERREFVSDRIYIKGREVMKTKSWLKYGGILTIKFPATFEENGRRYIWRSSIVHQLSLYLESDPSRPIAWFETSKKRVVNGAIVVQKAYLALEPEAVEIRDIVVLSLLILELKNRMAQKSEELVVGQATTGTVVDGGLG